MVSRCSINRFSRFRGLTFEHTSPRRSSRGVNMQVRDLRVGGGVVESMDASDVHDP